MTNTTAQQEVLAWYENGCDYDQGTLLYAKYGKNQMMKKMFPGKEKTYSTKLQYELCKSVGIDLGALKKGVKTFAVVKNDRIKPEPQKTAPQIKATALPDPAPEMPETIPVKDISKYPPIIRRLIAEYAEMFQERSKAHRIMTEMPDGNGQTLKMKREELFNLVKWFTGRLELFFAAREAYEKNGQLPDENLLWPKPKEEAKAELPDDVDALKRMKKNQQSANVKDQNMLDYQTEKKGTKPSPMPAGPKRMRIENRIKGRVKLIEQIDYKLLKV